jgi:hypothetical protein
MTKTSAARELRFGAALLFGVRLFVNDPSLRAAATKGISDTIGQDRSEEPGSADCGAPESG